MNDIIIQAQRQTNALLTWRNTELEDLFATLPAGEMPQGWLRGTMFSVRGLDWLARPLAGGLYRLLETPINPWRGKSFAGDSGSNQWGRLPGGSFGSYSIGLHHGQDGGESIWLVYNVAGNPRLLRNIRGEARQLQTGLWLARMLWQAGQQQTTLLWFTLSACRHAR